jgi:HK97 family phage prohead protease
VAATVADGTKVIFAQGSLPVDGKAPRLYMNHDSTNAIGIVSERVDTPEGMMFTAKISRTQAGDEALILAQDGVLDSVSVGVNPIDFTTAKDGTITVLEAEWLELSLVPVPAFAGATITEIAASIPQDEPEISIIETEPTQETETMSEPVAVPEVITASAPIFAQPKKSFAMPSAAEYLASMHQGGDTWVRVNRAFKENLLEKSSAYNFALAQDLTTDTAGLLEQRLLGPVIQDLNFVRPVVNALGVTAMPGNSKTFTKTKITQHTSTATQTEGAEVNSTKMTLSANTVTKSTLAGGVFISQQDIDMTAIPAMQTIINDLMGEWMIKSDDIAADALVAAATASGSTWTFSATDPSSLINALYDAAREMAEDTNYFPTHLYCAPNVWEKLGRQLDGSNRPVFPYVNGTNNVGMNTLGSTSELSYAGINPLGLQLVVDNNFASGTMIVAHTPTAGQNGSATSGFTYYEDFRGIMSLENPTLLGREMTAYGYVATFAGIPVCIQSIITA